MRRSWFIAAVMMIAAGGILPAEQITKIAVINLSEVYTAFFEESRGVKQLEEMREEIQDRVDQIKEEIKELQEKKVQAENDGQDSRVLELEEVISERQNYLREYYRVKKDQLERKRQGLIQNKEFLAEILNEISYVAEAEGYSAVLRSSDDGLFWWSQEVDITDTVIQRLREKASGQ